MSLLTGIKQFTINAYYHLSHTQSFSLQYIQYIIIIATILFTSKCMYMYIPIWVNLYIHTTRRYHDLIVYCDICAINMQ